MLEYQHRLLASTTLVLMRWQMSCFGFVVPLGFWLEHVGAPEWGGEALQINWYRLFSLLSSELKRVFTSKMWHRSCNSFSFSLRVSMYDCCRRQHPFISLGSALFNSGLTSSSWHPWFIIVGSIIACDIRSVGERSLRGSLFFSHELAAVNKEYYIALSMETLRINHQGSRGGCKQINLTKNLAGLWFPPCW